MPIQPATNLHSTRQAEDDRLRTPKRLLFNVSEVKEDGETLDGAIAPDSLNEAVANPDRLVFENGPRYALLAQRLGNGFLLKGRVDATARCRCDRCLTYYDRQVANPDACHFYEGIVEGDLDVTDDLCEDLLINLPQKQLCDDDCRGLCPECGQNLNARQCDCEIADDAGGIWHQLDQLDL